MTLKMNTTDEFVVALNLNINYDTEQISLRVSTWDKKNHKAIERDFSAGEFSDALHYYEEQEKMMEEELKR